MKAFELTGRVSIVTGAAGLLGREHCQALAAAGSNIVACDVTMEPLVDLAATLRERFGVSVLTPRVDISDADSVDALRATVLERFGRIDVLVNNAAIDDKFESPALAATASRFEVYPLEQWRRSLDVNLTGTFLCCQRLGRVMAEQRRGSIINIASTYGMVAPQQSLYCGADGTQTFHKSPAYPVSKAGVIQLTRFLASYWGEAGVRVNALSPGGVYNAQSEIFASRYAARVPLKRMARRTDFHGAVVFLASDASSYVTGTNLVVDGGWTVW